MKKHAFTCFVSIGLVGLSGGYSIFLRSGFGDFARSGFIPTSSSVPVVVRSEPSVSIRLRDMQDPNRGDINLRIPERYIKLGDAGETVTVTGPLAFYFTYPDMSGGREKQNADIPYCVGSCRGLTQVTLYNSSNTKNDKNTDLNDYINDEKKYILRRSGRFSSIYEEYDVMWRHFPFNIWRGALNRSGPKPSVTKDPPPMSLHAAPPPGYVTEDTYNAYLARPWPAAHIFIFRKRSSEREVVECKGDLSDPNKAMCEYRGRSENYNNLAFRLSFKYALMKDWPEFVQSVSRLIDGFVVR